MSKTLFMETTKINPEQTVGEIQSVLGKYGAAGIQMEYQDGEIKAVAFILNIQERRVPFLLPCRWEAVYKTMTGRMRKQRASRADEYVLQSKRVAWRQILRWVEAQMAMVETDMVKIEEVFMPYAVIDNKGTTLFQKMVGSKFLLESK